MPEFGDLTVRDARALFFQNNGLAHDGGYSASWWSCRLGRLKLVFYNFRWRRRAIPQHDLHHIVTGYPCTPAGEIQMAAWEFAAGRFPHPCATLFCLPLVFLGAVFLPRRSFAAFLRGRKSTSLYATPLGEDLLGSRLSALRAERLPATEAKASPRDRLAYGILVAQSAALVLGPALASILMIYAASS